MIQKALELETSNVPFEVADVGNTVSSPIPFVLQTLEGIGVSTPIAKIKVDVPLVSQGLDSLDVATLTRMLALESKYNDRLRTIEDIVAFLNA